MRKPSTLSLLVVVLLLAGGGRSPAAEPVTCTDVVDVKSSSPLRPTQASGVGWGTLPFETGYGFFQNNVWQDSGKVNEALEPIAIMLQDEKVANQWRARTITIWCADGRQLAVKVPQFMDVGGPGFADANGRPFPHGFWVAKDGRVFHDKKLTQPVP